MMVHRGLLLILISIFPLVAAATSSEWVEAPAYAPNVKVLVHRDSLQDAEASTVSVQRHSLAEPKVKKLVAQLKRQSAKTSELYPQECYQAKRTGMKSTQTWCVGKGLDVFAFIELGPRKMRENERQKLVFATLQVQP
jgi:hypothetical protein